MKIQIASDLHLEFEENRAYMRDNPLKVKAEILILAGDTVPFCKAENASDFYDRIEQDFSTVITIPGNHEFYQGNIDPLYPSCKETLRSNILMLNNHTLEYDGIVFISSILWTQVPPEHQNELAQMMNDFRFIFRKTGIRQDKKLFDIPCMHQLHQLSKTYLKKELQRHQDRKTVVITHHVPVYETMPRTYQESILRWGYGNDLKELILANPQIKLWVSGHCHYGHYSRLGETIICRNPLGYVHRGQQKGFDHGLAVDI